MIILDTHVWVWWMDGGAQLPADYSALLQAEAANGLGVCAKNRVLRSRKRTP